MEISQTGHVSSRSLLFRALPRDPGSVCRLLGFLGEGCLPDLQMVTFLCPHMASQDIFFHCSWKEGGNKVAKRPWYLLNTNHILLGSHPSEYLIKRL